MIFCLFILNKRGHYSEFDSFHAIVRQRIVRQRIVRQRIVRQRIVIVLKIAIYLCRVFFNLLFFFFFNLFIYSPFPLLSSWISYSVSCHCIHRFVLFDILLLKILGIDIMSLRHCVHLWCAITYWRRETNLAITHTRPLNEWKPIFWLFFLSFSPIHLS